ncbi:MAG: pilin [Candidatus Pacebacteria bacterium]|nr:pilin [Candidatus Paceibacterota bacterium]
MMKRAIPIGFGAIAMMTLSFFAVVTPVAHAQTCTPACASGSTCAYTDTTNTTTYCLAQDVQGATQVGEVVVTPSSKSTTSTASGSTFATIVQNFVTLINSYFVPLLYALAFLYFVWGIAEFMMQEGQEARDRGRKRMIYGIIGLVVIFSVWGLVNILLTTLTNGLG